MLLLPPLPPPPPLLKGIVAAEPAVPATRFFCGMARGERWLNDDTRTQRHGENGRISKLMSRRTACGAHTASSQRIGGAASAATEPSNDANSLKDSRSRKAKHGKQRDEKMEGEKKKQKKKNNDHNGQRFRRTHGTAAGTATPESMETHL